MEVVALVGPAGTGKSHRASLLAHDLEADAIVDDGLLIQGSRIVAGRSAKAEPTWLQAVRCALFTDPEHRRQVREALAALNCRRVLVLGTSEEMVRRICRALELPPPARVVSIYEVATPDEIRNARRVRRRLGQHVIPAPTFEVKRTLSGLLVNPLRLFYRPRHGRSSLLIEKSLVRPTFNSLGRFYIADTAVAAIAQHAARTAPGVQEVLRVQVSSEPEGVEVALDLAVGYGASLVEAARVAQRRAREALEYMTDLPLRSVDVYVRRVVPCAPEGEQV